MKRKITDYFFSLIVVLVLSGCASQKSSNSMVETVPNLFTQSTMPIESTQSLEETEATEAPSLAESYEQMPLLNMSSMISSWELPEYTLDEVGHYVAYEGGEMHLPFSFSYKGDELSKYGVAVMIFVDGQIQPFRLKEDGSLQYVHIVYPKESTKTTEELLELMFTPISGEKGSVLDLSIYTKQFADWQWGNENTGWDGYSSSITTRLKFMETPPETDLPEKQSHILEWNCQYTDATLEEYENWEENAISLLRTCAVIDGEGYRLGVGGYRYLYNASAEVPMEIAFDLINSSGVEYDIVIFVDNEPVSVDPEDRIYVNNASGQRATVSVKVAIPDFEGRSKVFAVILPRNYLATIGDSSDFVIDLVDTEEFFLFAEKDWNEVVK